MKQIHCLFVFALLSLIVVGCATTNGRILGGRYYSPINNFTLELPNWLGMQIEDGNFDNAGGRVSLHGDMGNLWAITCLRLPANAESTLKDDEERDAEYSRFLKNFAMPSLFRQASKDARIVHEEFLGESENRAYFAVVSIPEGSAMFDLKKNKRLDSLRGLLIFDKRGFMYMVESEMDNIFSEVDPSSLNPKQLESSQSTLKRVIDRMVFK